MRVRPMIILPLAALAACMSEPDAGTPVAGNMPPIHVDQRVFLASLRANAVDSYQARLDACREAGLPSEALSAEDIEKLGTVRFTRWIDRDRAAYRWEEFHLGAGPAGPGIKCHFYLTSLGNHFYLDAGGVERIDFENNHFADGSLNANLRHLLDRKPLPEQIDPARLGSMDTVHGHACVRHPVKHALGTGTACTWGGGQQWMFSLSDMGFASSDSSASGRLNTIVLQQSPDAPGTAPIEHVETLRFEIGTPLDHGAMKPRPASAWPAHTPRN